MHGFDSICRQEEDGGFYALGVPVGELKKWESVYEFPVFMAFKYPMSWQIQC